jgi:hypothetical protein
MPASAREADARCPIYENDTSTFTVIDEDSLSSSRQLHAIELRSPTTNIE